MRALLTSIGASALGLVGGVLFAFTPLADSAFRLLGGQGYDGWERILFPFLFGGLFGLISGVAGLIYALRAAPAD